MPKKKTLLAGLVALASSPKGRRMIADARTKYDTPENRKKVGDAISQLRKKGAAQPTR
jgi:multisubunit Na+/H+ antiporter MnhG subunit